MIVAFGHQQRRGKDSAARFMMLWLKIRKPKTIVRRVAFADYLKQQAAHIYGWAGLRDGVYYDNNPELKEKILLEIGKSPRTIWIEFGNYMRQIYPLTWVKKALSSYNLSEVILITDLRYPNEADCIRTLGGRCILIQRPGLAEPTDIADTALNGFSWDGVIMNDGTLSDLEKSVSQIAQSIFGEC